MKNVLLAIAVFFCAAAQTHAQGISKHASLPGFQCGAAAAHARRPLLKVTGASPALDSYDVRHVKLDLKLSNLNTTVSGSATITAMSRAVSGLSNYVFELSAFLTIDSLKLNGLAQTATSLSPDLRSIAFPAAVANGAVFTAQVFYHGTPPAGSGFFTHALNHYTVSGTDITYTLSDPYFAKEWWPCKQSLTDKIDSADLWFTVPNSAKAGSNGLLQGTAPIGTGDTRWEWKTRYPIEYYLISAAVAPYVTHTQMMRFTGSPDSMPVQHFVYDTAAFNRPNRAAIDSTPLMVDYFSTLYGRYPFWKEKYGHCVAPLGGGMEHQTMTTLGAFSTPLIAHELGHQWWGDAVTYGSWRDIWLSEGFAAYCEQLFIEHFRSVAAARAYRTGVFNRVQGAPGGSVYVDDTTNTYRIFDSRLTYDKGAAVAHMLRYIAPADSLFFAGLRAYQSLYAYKTATTADFQAVMEGVYGRRLDTFFAQWVYGEGYPTYTPTFNQRGRDVYIQLAQTGSKPASVAAFAMPVALRLVSLTGDTVVKIYLNRAAALYSFKWSQAVTDVVVDPFNEIVNRSRAAEYDVALGVDDLRGEGIHIAPNPAGDRWNISGVPPGAMMELTDVSGKVIIPLKVAPAAGFIDGSGLAPGVYILTVSHATGSRTTRKLVKH